MAHTVFSWLPIFYLIVSCQATSYWVRDSSLDDVINAGSSDAYLSNITTHTKGECALVCKSRAWCSSFFYSHTSGACSLRSVAVMSTSGALPSLGSAYYKRSLEWCDVRTGSVYYPDTNFCFRVYADVRATNWTEARASCQAAGMDLVSADTPAKLDALMKTIKETPEYQTVNLYTGLVRPLDKWSNGTWVNGQPEFVWLSDNSTTVNSSALPWAPGQPNNVLDIQHCVQVDRLRGLLLNDLLCTDAVGYICGKTK